MPLTSRFCITPSSTDLVTNTVTETAFAQYLTIEAATLKKSCLLEFGGAVKNVQTNSTDTLTVKAYLGTDLTNAGALIFDSGALDVADNDICAFGGQFFVNTYAGASAGLLCGLGFGVPKSAGTAKFTTLGAVSAKIDLTARMYLYVMATWSVASASNKANLTALWAKVQPFAV